MCVTLDSARSSSFLPSSFVLFLSLSLRQFAGWRRRRKVESSFSSSSSPSPFPDRSCFSKQFSETLILRLFDSFSRFDPLSGLGCLLAGLRNKFFPYQPPSSFLPLSCLPCLLPSSPQILIDVIIRGETLLPASAWRVSPACELQR